MNDAQTTGGYPRIACIIEADMYHLAQIPLGQPIHFVQCSLEEALKARQDQQRYFEQLAWRLHNEIDLNADLGEGCASDAELLTLVSSANIACGFHAGDAQTMQACVREAIKMVSRLALTRVFPTGKILVAAPCSCRQKPFSPRRCIKLARRQRLPDAQGGVMCHVKPHGMLYNRAAKEAQLADAIARAVYACDPALILVGLAGSELIRAGERYGW